MDMPTWPTHNAPSLHFAGDVNQSSDCCRVSIELSSGFIMGSHGSQCEVPKASYEYAEQRIVATGHSGRNPSGPPTPGWMFQMDGMAP